MKYCNEIEMSHHHSSATDKRGSLIDSILLYLFCNEQLKQTHMQKAGNIFGIHNPSQVAVTQISCKITIAIASTSHTSLHASFSFKCHKLLCVKIKCPAKLKLKKNIYLYHRLKLLNPHSIIQTGTEIPTQLPQILVPSTNFL